MAIQVGKISPLHNLWSPTIGAGQGWTIRKCDTSVQSTTPVPPSSVPTDITIMLLVGGAGPAPVYGSAGTGGGGRNENGGNSQMVEICQLFILAASFAISCEGN